MARMELSNSERERVEREDGVWREIKEHHRKGTHVKGRVLNPVNGGYAVGIAGLVCFLPIGAASVRGVQRRQPGSSSRLRSSA